MLNYDRVDCNNKLCLNSNSSNKIHTIWSMEYVYKNKIGPGSENDFIIWWLWLVIFLEPPFTFGIRLYIRDAPSPYKFGIFLELEESHVN